MSEWISDNHWIRVHLDHDSMNVEVLCPGEDMIMPMGQPPKCGAGDPEGTGCCSVKEAMAEVGVEGNDTGLPIIVQGILSIDYRWVDGEEFWWKVSGYQDSDWIKERRKEISDMVGSRSYIDIPVEMAGTLSKPLGEVSEEKRNEIQAEYESLKEENTVG